MLILSRKPGQRIYVGDDITITVLEMHGGQVRLGIEAPRSVAVWRDDAKHRPEIRTAWGDVPAEGS